MLLKMGLPTIIGMMVTGIYNLVDTYFVEGLGTSQMVAVSVIFPLGRLSPDWLFCSAARPPTSLDWLGANECQKANQVASMDLYSSLIVAAIAITAIVIL